MTLQFDPNQLCTLLTDGVIEASSPSGELYGFERTQAISNNSANSIAETAREFGQQDDITVLTVSRSGG
jgi:serine phosphatase RsbU (regulator of sigma subunit)